MMSIRWTDNQDLFLTAVLRARESRGLSREILDRMLRARTVAEALEALKGTVYDHPEQPAVDVQDRLDRRREALYRFVAGHTAHRDLVRLIALPHDVHNLKIALKEALFGGDNTDLWVPWGSLSADALSDIVRREAYEALPDFLAAAVVEAIEGYFTDKRPARIDLALDRAMHAGALSLCARLKTPALTGYWVRRIDLANIRAFARRRAYDAPGLVSRLFIPGGRLLPEQFLAALSASDRLIAQLASDRDYGSMAEALDRFDRAPLALEREADRLLTVFLEPFQCAIGGVGAVYSHVCAVERELSLLSLVFAALQHHVPRELLDQRLPVLWGEAS
jgi:vacuolar-type H+-ATPase subunit C/Vma6